MEIIGQNYLLYSPAVARAVDSLSELMAGNQPILVGGEEGVGKTGLIQAVLEKFKQPYLTFDPRSITPPEQVKHLFGAVHTGFLGRTHLEEGLIDKVERGFLIIRSLEKTSGELQERIIRLIRTGGYSRFGEEGVNQIRRRVIITLNGDLRDLVSAGFLRPEFLEVVKGRAVSLPSLGGNREAIATFTDFFLDYWSEKFSLPQPTLNKEGVRYLQRARWPQNIFQLRKVIAQAVLEDGGGEITAQDLKLIREAGRQFDNTEQLEDISLEELVERRIELFLKRLRGYETHSLHEAVMSRVERPLLKLVLGKTKGNQLRAARLLGINRNTLRSKIKRLKLEVN